MIKFFVEGRQQNKKGMIVEPAPKGSRVPMKHIYTQKDINIESSVYVPGWMKKIATIAAVNRPRPVYKGPVAMSLEFVMDRPKSHYVNNDRLKPLKQTAPYWHITRRHNDMDKLVRAVLDALTGIIYVDDSQVCWWGLVEKHYTTTVDNFQWVSPFPQKAPTPKPGVYVQVRRL